MGAEENRRVHTEWYEAENRLDLSHHEDYLHDDIEVCQAGAEPVVGIPAYREMMESAYATLPDFHTVVDDQIATDTRVIARWRTSAAQGPLRKERFRDTAALAPHAWPPRETSRRD